jgi:hypothetical protein
MISHLNRKRKRVTMNDDPIEHSKSPCTAVNRRQLMCAAATAGGLLMLPAAAQAASRAGSRQFDPELRRALWKYGGEFAPAGSHRNGGSHGDL